MKSLQYELNVIVGDRSITEYESQGNIFVEGRKGSEFKIEFKNLSNSRVLVVPSVDGRSVLDGKTATPDSKGYLVNAYSTLTIPGWTLNSGEVSKFVFEDKDKSYASRTATTGENVQVGVVGVMVFVEKIEVPTYISMTNAQPYYPTTYPYPPYPTAGNPPWLSTQTHTVSPTQTVWNSASCMNASMSAKSIDAQILAASAASVSETSNNNSDNNFAMGTGFGPRADFKTNEVKFNKGSSVATLAIYYDTRRNLEKRGIQVVRRETRYLNDLPTPFSNTGCTPPAGWTG